MAERRKLTTAINTPAPEVDELLVRRFVTQNQASEQPTATFPKNDAEPTREGQSPAQVEPIKQESPAVGSKNSRLRPVGLIPITVRLRPELAGGLRRASLERELQGAELYTQQDLVEQVLEPWLKQEGYLV